MVEPDWSFVSALSSTLHCISILNDVPELFIMCGPSLIHFCFLQANQIETLNSPPIMGSVFARISTKPSDQPLFTSKSKDRWGIQMPGLKLPSACILQSPVKRFGRPPTDSTTARVCMKTDVHTFAWGQRCLFFLRPLAVWSLGAALAET